MGWSRALNRPDANVTGVVFFSGVLGTKRLALLRQLAPDATTIAILMNFDTREAEEERRDVEAAGQATGLKVIVVDPRSNGDIEPAFATFAKLGAGALIVGSVPFLNSNRELIVALAAQHRLPASYSLDRLDAAMLMRVFLGWLRGERGHCGMVAIPTMEEEDARRPNRERESLVNERSRIINRMKSALARLGIRGFKPHLRKAPERLAGLRTAEGTGLPANIIEEFRRDMARLALVREQISSIEKTRAERLERAPDTGPHAMVRLLARVIGIGIETADMLVRGILSRKLRDRRAVARYAGLTGSPDESGLKSREKGLAKAGNARVRRGLIQLAWRFLMFQKDSALARWYRTRTEGPSGARKTTMIVALARKLLIALWRLVTTGEVRTVSSCGRRHEQYCRTRKDKQSSAPDCT